MALRSIPPRTRIGNGMKSSMRASDKTGYSMRGGAESAVRFVASSYQSHQDSYPINAVPKGKGYTPEARRHERKIIQERLSYIEDEISRWASEGLYVDNLVREADKLKEELKTYW